MGRQNGQVFENASGPFGSGLGRPFQSRRIADRLLKLRRPLPDLGHGFRPVFEDVDRRRQSARFVRQILAKRQIHFGRHAGQYLETVGLFKGIKTKIRF